MKWTGAEIKRRRLALGLTQQQLADLAGLSRRAIVNWEGGTPPRNANIRKLEEVLGEAPLDDVQRILDTAEDIQIIAQVAKRMSRKGWQGPAVTLPGIDLDWPSDDAPSAQPSNEQDDEQGNSRKA